MSLLSRQHMNWVAVVLAATLAAILAALVWRRLALVRSRLRARAAVAEAAQRLRQLYTVPPLKTRRPEESRATRNDALAILSGDLASRAGCSPQATAASSSESGRPQSASSATESNLVYALLILSIATSACSSLTAPISRPTRLL
jgi:hypothetical protein